MKTIEVVSAIIIKHNMVFVTQRGYGEFKDQWEFPGGKIEPGESKENAIVREIKEELDADIQIVSFLNTIKYEYPSFKLIMHNFICALASEHLKLLEHEAAKFIAPEDLDEVPFLPADRLILPDLKKYLNKKCIS